ncbi:MAG: phosphoglucosamine mutase [Betaproteobacteria bacterium]|jgi:phosphoglucosamine mutase
MTRKYFGTDGIRGRVGQSPITADFVLRLAHAVGRVLRKTEDKPTVLIGKDTRISGYMLESALESGFNSAGVNVVLLGPLPTPGVAYLTRAQRASLGVVISASHNAFDDNGIKFFSAHGTKLSDAWEMDVESALDEAPVWADSANLGKAKRLDDAAGRYIEFCKSTFSNELTLKGLKIVVDAAHGAAYQIAPKVFHELGAEVIAIGCTPDGLNINHEVGATHPDALVKAVKANQADYGIALDGDADRLQLVDASGRLFNGDELLYLMVDDRLSQGEKIHGVVGTLMTNMAVELAFQKRGIAFVRSKVGDRYVLEELEKQQWILGGEGSGHLLVLDKHTTGDGLVSALQILQTCVRSGRTMAELLFDVTLYPQTLINVRLRADQKWQDNSLLKQETQKVEAELGQTGRVLIRASGTEPLVRVMVEARDNAQARSCAERIAATLQ